MANTIYALLVGINKYQASDKPLNACINDANNMKTYLETAAAQSGAKLSLVMLTDEQATREKVLRTFEKQLGQADKDDVALFYFSGHGGRESAHPAFRHTEKDNTLETLICHDSAYVRGIADKELRYLIHKISTKNPHVVIITDSCHSGDVTRHNDPDYRVKQIFPPAKEKLGSVFAQRSWKEFIFSNELTETKANASAANLDAVLPQGKHVHIAACKSEEEAIEVGDNGVFTYALLQVLTKSAGNITYQNLHNRLLALADENLAVYNRKQTPQIYVFDKNHKSALSAAPDVLYERFLGGLVKGEPIHANVTYNAIGNYWQIDMGAIHGLPTIGLETIKVDVVNDQTKSTIAKATVKKVFANHAEITINTNNYISTSDTFGAFVSDVLATPLLFTTAGNTAGIALLNSFYSDNRRRLQRSNIFAAQRGNMLNAYRITAQNNRYELTYGNSKLPLARAIEGYTRSAANAMFTYLTHIARWQYVKKFPKQQCRFCYQPS
ncbi:MAG TPA: caspase family protein [Chitinophagales bacterium]|nr:caspase family protein [Chitinophagales bacterium]